MEKKLASVFQYFANFDYFPSFEDVYTFFPSKISKKRLKKIYEYKKYTLPQYRIISNNQSVSKKKLNNWRLKLYIKIISLFSQIKLVGLSGSISMMNAKKDDDIDLFIITAENRLFTARFLATIIAIIMGLKRALGQHKATNKVCLNLFFDESNLKVPKYKQTLFVGHEVLQMKPITNKSQTYEKFLSANRWVLSFFPNAAEISNFKFLISNQFQILKFKKLGDWLEKQLKNFQLNLINRHKTTEIVTDAQLWFHPDDFEKKIKF